jgi:transcriptional regulator with XRE-family HTH domain
MEPLRTVAELCAEKRISVRELAERAGLDDGRVLAIAEGRWLPSPTERDRIAAVFRLERDQIAWGHRASVQHLYGHGPQFGRTP